MRVQLDNDQTPVEQREHLALEIASTLDRAAHAAATPDAQCARWAQAVAVLDEFREKNPTHSQADEFDTQAAVYLWAEAKTWTNQWELSPGDTRPRDRAIAALDDSIKRLRDVNARIKDPSTLIAENVRYRLAQSLADRAEFEKPGSEPRKARNDEALKALEPPIKEPSLRGFSLLLQGALLGEAGLFDDGRAAVDEAEKCKPAPPPSEVLLARVGILIGQERFDEALKFIGASKIDIGPRGLLAVRTRLAQRADLPPGREQSAVETALFQSLKGLRATERPESRLALIAVAQTLEVLDSEQDPEAWDTLAEGYRLLGDPAKAGALEAKAADRAIALGDAAKAITLRLRAGAYLFQAEKFAEADALLTQVYDDPKSGAARPKAGLLRILARGRALATGRPGATAQTYQDALSAQIRDFPNDLSTGEARWLLGQLRHARGEDSAALALWAAIPPASPHWLDARTASARIQMEALADLRVGNDRSLVARHMDATRKFLAESAEQSTNDLQRCTLDLSLARLELTPEAGRPEQARSVCDRIQKSAVSPDIHAGAQRLHLVALGCLNHYVEAEREARAVALDAPPAALLDTVRLLDYSASESDSELRARRFGHLMRTLLGRLVQNPDELTPDQLRELQLRQTRSLLLSGDRDGARRSLNSWASTPPTADDDFLRDLADTYFRLDAFELAVDVERLRARRNATGSARWFQARYNQALAYYRSGKEREARQLIDGTSILHPDLGGGELRDKFVRLRQRLSGGGGP